MVLVQYWVVPSWSRCTRDWTHPRDVLGLVLVWSQSRTSPGRVPGWYGIGPGVDPRVDPGPVPVRSRSSARPVTVQSREGFGIGLGLNWDWTGTVRDWTGIGPPGWSWYQSWSGHGPILVWSRSSVGPVPDWSGIVMDRDWTARCGPGPVPVWSRYGLVLVLVQSRTGPGFVRDWSGIGPRLVSALVPRSAN